MTLATRPFADIPRFMATFRCKAAISDDITLLDIDVWTMPTVAGSSESLGGLPSG